MKRLLYALSVAAFMLMLIPGIYALPTGEPDSLDVEKQIIEKLPAFAKRISSGLARSEPLKSIAGKPPPKVHARTYQFPELDEQLDAEFEKADNSGAIYGATTDTEFAAELMVKLNAYNASDKVKKARKVLDKAISLGNFIKKLTGNDMVSFPLVLSDTISNNIYTVIFNKMELYPTYTELEVMVRIYVPAKNRELFFGSPNIKFTKTGGFVGEVKLGLYAELPIVIGQEKAALILNKWEQVGTGENVQDIGTYVIVDCDGFVEMGLEADLMMSRDWVIPVDQMGDPQTTGRVTAHIQAIVHDWNDILVDFTLPDFVVTAMPDVTFNLQNAVFDFSDFRNSHNMVFPEIYADQQLLAANPNLWRGVYIKNLDVMLPRQFSKRNCQLQGNGTPGGGTGSPGIGSFDIDLDTDDAYAFSDGHKGGPSEEYLPPPEEVIYAMSPEHCRFTFGAQDLLIDDQGVSGYFYADNVFALNEGKMDTWKFSLDHVEIDIVINEVTAFGFGGEVGIPVAKQNKPFGYSAFRNIENDTYSFSVITRSDMEFSIWQAVDVAIDSSSKLNVFVTPDAFIPSAELTGSFSVHAKYNLDDTADEAMIEVVGLEFTKLLVRSEAPRLSIAANGGNIALTSGLKLANLPVAISDIELVAVPGDPESIELSFSVNVNFMGEQDGGFAAATNFGIIGRLEQEVTDTNQDPVDVWVYDHLEFNSAEIHMQFSNHLVIDGYVEIFNNDVVYGKGFQGILTIDVIDKITINTSAIFGNTGVFSYWNFDAMLESDEWGIPLFGPIQANGFGGGAYHNMRMVGIDPVPQNNAGVSLTGAQYVPDQSVKLGLKAIMALTSTGGAMDGTVSFEIVFGQNMNLLEILFYGRMDFMVPEELTDGIDIIKNQLEQLNLTREETEEQTQQSIDEIAEDVLAGAFVMSMNFEAGLEFQATFEAQIDVADHFLVGNGVVDLFFSAPEDRWHLYIGGYSNGAVTIPVMDQEDEVSIYPVQVTITYENNPNDPSDDIVVQASAYFLMGNDIPGAPPLDPAAAAFFGVQDNREDLGDSAALGAGFAFGANVHFHIYYEKAAKRFVTLEGGAGFDFALLKYNSGSVCSLSGTSPHGLKYWRATGNIWAYLSAYGKWWGIPFNTGVGVMLAGDGPKPSSFHIDALLDFGIFDLHLQKDIGTECGTVQGGNDNS
jgi:hypothetical protein